MLGVVLEQAHPLRLREISEHPRSSGFPPHHPVMHSFLGAPIVVRGRVFGRLYLSEKEGGAEFSEGDERIAMMLAAQAGVAIESVFLYDEVQARGVELGRRLAQLGSLELVARMLLTEDSSIGDVLEYAVEQARFLTGGTMATLMVLDEATGELVIRHAVGGEGAASLVGVRLEPRTSKSHFVMLRRDAELVPDLASDREINEGVRHLLGNPADGAFAPLLVRHRPIGALAVYGSSEGRPFTDDDLSVLQILANQAAIALENDRLTFLLRNLAVLEERERISKELHDGVIQSIYSVGLNLQGALSLMGTQPDRGARRIEEAIAELDNVVRDVRNYIFELRPRLVEERGLEAAIVELVRELEVNTTAHATVELAPRAGQVLPRQQEAHVIQIVREVLSNIARHAQPSVVSVKVEQRGGFFSLVIEDDGLGFDPSKVSRGHGLSNVEARVEALGGVLEILPRAGGGTRHSVRVPLPAEETF
ncbi:MAG: GAF domain-containing sensor histidine kinase [Actinobacteria bacterium]|nr:MAG: GAF domain-containing sensor histidine kinase [Actinomycetota bacterium]